MQKKMLQFMICMFSTIGAMDTQPVQKSPRKKSFFSRLTLAKASAAKHSSPTEKKIITDKHLLTKLESFLKKRKNELLAQVNQVETEVEQKRQLDAIAADPSAPVPAPSSDYAYKIKVEEVDGTQKRYVQTNPDYVSSYDQALGMSKHERIRSGNFNAPQQFGFFKDFINQLDEYELTSNQEQLLHTLFRRFKDNYRSTSYNDQIKGIKAEEENKLQRGFDAMKKLLKDNEKVYSILHQTSSPEPVRKRTSSLRDLNRSTLIPEMIEPAVATSTVETLTIPSPRAASPTVRTKRQFQHVRQRSRSFSGQPTSISHIESGPAQATLPTDQQ